MQRDKNSYAKPKLGKCFKCNQPRNQSSDCPLRKISVHMIDINEEKEGEVYCDPDSDVNEY